jgi:hypothetical protein
MVWLSKNWQKNKGKDYPQTWNYMPRPGKKIWLRKTLEWLCGVTGHEISKTEWGYGGGEYADVWCRWCDKMLKVPKTSIMFKNKMARDLMGEVKGCGCSEEK